MYVSRFIGRSLLVGFTIATMVGPAVAAGRVGADGSGDTRSFTTHAAEFAARHRNSAALDPAIFVADSEASAGDGPEHIHHVAGYRPARLHDDPALPLYAANGTPLKLSVGRWFAARGDARADADADGDRLTVHFSHLVPFGNYSLFAMPRQSGDQHFEALRNNAGKSLFTASPDGDARMTVVLPEQAQNADIALVLHSDDIEHDGSPGDLGVTAHPQLLLAAGSSTSDRYAAPAADEADQDAPIPDDSETGPASGDLPMRNATPQPRSTPSDFDDEAPSDDAAPNSTADPDDQRGAQTPDNDHNAPPTDDGEGDDQAPI